MNSLPMLSMKSMAFDIGYHNCYSTTLDTAFFFSFATPTYLFLCLLHPAMICTLRSEENPGSERNMCHCSGFQSLWILLCLRIGSGLGIHQDTVIAMLNKPIEIHVPMNQTVCSDVVEWYKQQPSTLCLRYHPPNNSTSLGAWDGRAQFHCQNNSLVLNTVIQEHEGTYMEKIISQDGSVKKAFIITLKIISPPLITNVSIISTQTTLIIMCEVSGRNASTRWLKDGVDLQNLNWTLMVHEPTWRDCGNYTCLATSEGGSSEAHVHIKGDYAICRKDQDIGHGNEMSITIGITSAVICVLGLCIIPVCIKKYSAGTCCNESWTPEDIGDTGPNDAAMEERHVYDELNNVQPNSLEAVQLPYVYTDFIPVKLSRSHREEAQVEDATGYSTIGDVLDQARTLQVLDQAQTLQVLDQARTLQVLDQAQTLQVLD